MKEQFLNYSQSFALKELGFDEPCFYYYKREKNNQFELYQDDLGRWYINTDVGEALLIWGEKYDTKQCSAPLYQQAFRWFREKYNLFSCIMTEYSYGGHISAYHINGVRQSNISLGDFTTYEEAENACIDKLINIAENKKV